MQLREDLGPAKRRSLLLFLCFMLALGALHLRLAHLQLVNGAHWRRMAENNRVRRLPVASNRGRIYDRRGRVLADNLPTFELLLFPDEARDLANKKVAADPRMGELMAASDTGFDAVRMAYGGFSRFV